MSPRTKSILLLAGVLLLGMLLGALGSGTVFNRRLAKIAELRTSRGMAFVLEEVVRPETEEIYTAPINPKDLPCDPEDVLEHDLPWVPSDTY